MVKPNIPDLLVDLAKIIGKTMMDVADTGDYRVTILIEKKIDDKQGVVIENISIDKRMNVVEVEIVRRRLKDLIDKMK